MSTEDPPPDVLIPPPAAEISDATYPVHPDLLDWEAQNIPEPPTDAP